MKAFLLAGGYGTRLKPLTDKTPKCLVDIAGKPLLEYWLEQLIRNGYTDILINTHYLNEKVEEYLAASDFANYVTTVYEPDLLGTLGSIRNNKSFFDSDVNLIAHADNLCLTDWPAFSETFKHRPDSCDLTMMLFNTSTPWSCGLVNVDSAGVLTHYIEKPSAAKVAGHRLGNLANAAVFIASPKAIKSICSMPDDCDDLCRDYLPLQIGKANTFINSNIHIDIGTPATYAQANEIMQQQGNVI